MTEIPRRLHYGGATPTRLASAIDRTDMTLVIENDTGWPKDHTLVGSFIITVDRGSTREERILCERITGTTIQVALGGRGYDMTTPVAHEKDAKVEHTFSAIEADELNLHLRDTSDVHGASGSLIGTNDLAAVLEKTDAIPPGVVVPFAGAVVPDGWLPCDGSWHSKAKYPKLYAAIGDVWGKGQTPPIGQFRLPDFQTGARFLRAAGTGVALGSSGGSAQVGFRINQNNLPGHSHTVPGHSHTIWASAAGGRLTTTGAGGHGHGLDAASTDHGHNIQTSGAGSHNHRLPWNYIAASGSNQVSVYNGATQGGLETNGGEGNHIHGGTTVGSQVNNITHVHTLHGVGDHTHDVSVVVDGIGQQTTSEVTGSQDQIIVDNIPPYLALNMLIKADARPVS